jgi:short-subunit dehydrogenase
MKHQRNLGTVVITGASGGVGRACARAFAPRARAVVLLARGETGLTAAAEEVRAAGALALPISVDVADPTAVAAAATRAEVEAGPIDVWVNVAFSSIFAPFIETSLDEFHRATEVTYLGYVHGTRAALDRMVPRNRGTIVQVGSALAYRGIPLQSAYCGAKHAIKGFTEAVRCELLHERSNVRITMVQLPAVNTPQFDWVLSRLSRHPQPVPPIYQPEVVAHAIVHAAEHPGRREYRVGASTMLTIAANAVIPGLLDRYLGRTGYRSQQTDTVHDRDTPNLWAPADQPPGHDHGAHGSFDARAHAHSPQVWASQHRGLLAAAGMTAGLAAAVRRARRHS